MSAKLRAINAISSPSYAQDDGGTARCRLSVNTLRDFMPMALIGSVVRVKVSITTKKFLIVICTVWPDSCRSMLDGYVCVDSTVQISTTSSSSKRQDSWVEGDCEILEVYAPPRPCSSIKYRIRVAAEPSTSTLTWNQTMQQRISPATLYGLPLVTKSTIQLKYPKQCVIFVHKTNPSEGVFIGGAGLLISAEQDKEKRKEITDVGITNNACRTKVVQEIIERIIDPVVNGVPSSLQFKGMMLLGPPGVGKSYSLRVVKQVCADRCQVEIVQVSIPELLAEDNPLQRLEKYLKIESDNASSITLPSMDAPSIISSADLGGVNVLSSPNVSTPYKFSASAIKSTSTVGSKKKSSLNRSDEDPSEKSIPKVIFLLLDEIDALGHQRNHNETQIAIKERISQWFDAVNSLSSKICYCMVASSNRAEDIDMMFRRGGRLEHEINVMNTQEDRSQLFLTYLQGMHILRDLNISTLADREENLVEVARYCAEKSGGYVAADIASLMREVTIELSKRTRTSEHLLLNETNSSESLQSSPLVGKGELIAVIEECMKLVPPSCLRGITIQLPNLTLDDVIGCHEAKKELTKALSFSSPNMKEKLARFGMNQSLGGVLLYGPPGNSKTRLITAAAATHNLPLISLSSADIYSAYVGDAEAEIRKAFTIARQAAPCILFFDEMDSLVINRAHGTSSSASGAASVEARVLSTFLNEMDGVNTNAGSAGVIVIGATNRIDCIDAALIRKGRFYQTIHVAPPTAEERIQLLEYFLRKAKLPLTLIDQMKWKLYEGMSGAQIENLCKEEAMKTALPTF